MEILEKSKTLYNYSFFMGKINEYKKYLSLEESVKAAVKYCIEHDILKEFLKNHGSEVFNMLFDEISTEEIAAVRSEEAREDGLEKGREEGREDERLLISRNLLAKGFSPEIISETTGLSIDEIAKL